MLLFEIALMCLHALLLRAYCYWHSYTNSSLVVLKDFRSSNRRNFAESIGASKQQSPSKLLAQDALELESGRDEPPPGPTRPKPAAQRAGSPAAGIGIFFCQV